MTRIWYGDEVTPAYKHVEMTLTTRQRNIKERRKKKNEICRKEWIGKLYIQTDVLDSHKFSG